MERVNGNPESSKPKSLVLEFPTGDHAAALSHFHAKLSLETDPSDVHADLQNGVTDFVIVDARSPENYARGHVPGAINFPHRQMNESTATALPKDKLIVVYCDGIGCNASTKGAAKLSALGFRVKEMLGGIDWWRRDGYPVEVTAEGEAVSAAPGREAVNSSCGC